MSGSLFDLRDATRIPAHDPIAGAGDAIPEDPPEHPLDTVQMQEQHRTLMQLYAQELDRQRDNRLQMAMDEDYYDGIQWSAEDAQALQERGQNPIVINHIAPTINWMLGSERRTRVDFRVLGRTKNDNEGAQTKTQLLKYLSDSNYLPFERSQAFKDAVVAGIGWLEDGAQYGDDGEELYSRYVSWREILHDSKSRFDLSDARYLFRSKMLDVDVALQLYKVPDNRRHIITDAIQDGLHYGLIGDIADEPMASLEDDFSAFGHTVRSSSVMHLRQRVRVIEGWYRVPEMRTQFYNGPAKGQKFDSANPEHLALLQTGWSVIDKFHMTMLMAAFTSAGLLWLGESPYQHNDFPFTPVWGNRRARDGMPYGLVRQLRDLQDDVNKKHSKAQYILASNKVVMDDGAVEDENVLAEEVARPDGIIKKRKGYELNLAVDRDLAPAHLELMRDSARMIQTTSGVTDELLGRKTNAVSGAAITARQEQGSLQTSTYFDWLRMARQKQGEKQLALIEQFYTYQKVVRITDDRGQANYITLNDPDLPESQIARSRADFIIDESAYSASYRQSMVETLGLVLQRLPPDLAAVLLPMMIEMMDIPNRDEIVKQLRTKLGIPDPDSDPTPEQVAAQRANQLQQQHAEEMMQLTQAEARARVEGLQMENALKRVQTAGQRIEAMGKAVTAAAVISNQPGVAPAADQMLAEAGFEESPAAVQAPDMLPPAAPQADPTQPQPGVNP
ncbi:hypothetical protein [Chromobacterium phragmitis]|uniref:Portal protein n=1 Tax=Chromobacterium phragmitis TaxID=2202141 RepID=A0A344UPD6_9NEIS|nr:hypothetical protein [Chromobacterium phragmitis]AXE37134.1 hypothetical protein DK843_22550 [Chromobacterium phragmitis]